MEQPPRYADSLEFEVPNYSVIQQLQNLPPVMTNEPSSLLDQGSAQNQSFDLGTPANEQNPPVYENGQPSQPLYQDSGYSPAPVYNNSPKTEPHQSQPSVASYPPVEVEDKIKDILSRYNPHAQTAPKQDANSSPDPFSQPTQPAQPVKATQLPQQPQIRQNNLPPNNQQAPPPVQQQQVAPIHQGAPSSMQPQYPVQQANKAQVHQPPQPLSPPQHQYFGQQDPQQLLNARLPQQNAPAPQQNSPIPLHVQRVAPPSVNYQPPQQQYQPQMYSPQVQQPYHSPQQNHVPAPNPVPQQPPVPQPAPIPQQAPAPHQMYPPQQQPQHPGYQQVQHPVQPQEPQMFNMQLAQQQNAHMQAQNMMMQQQHLNQQQSKEILTQIHSQLDKVSLYMERMDRRLTSLESTAQTILKNQKQTKEDDIGAIIAKTEVETLRKMQEQMENDFEVAKRMQAEIDSKLVKEKQQEDRRKSTPTPRPSTTFTPAPSSLQDCPICGSKVPFLELELHVNQCLEGNDKLSGDTKEPEKGSFWKRVFGPGPKKDDASQTPKNQPTKTPTPTPTPLPPNSPISLYPGNQSDMYQMPMVYRGGYPQMYGGYPQQIYYYPPNMQPPGNPNNRK